MPKYFAQLNEENIVLQVVTAESLEWCINNIGGEWVETFIENPNKNYAGIGYTYDEDKENFIAPKPFNSWSLNNNDQWTAPTPKPEGFYQWDEENVEWVEVIQ